MPQKIKEKTLKNLTLIIIGIFCAGFGLKGFLLPNSFIDGGVTGISLLVQNVTGISLEYLILIINTPFIALGYRQFGRSFALKSLVAIIGLALVIHYLEFPSITEDKLLVSVFGGFFLGAGIGLAMRGGAVLDGTEVLAIFLGRKTGATIGDLIMVFNIIIFATATYLLSIETALYAMLTYLAASKTVDFFIEGVEEYIGVTIVSMESQEIRETIISNFGRGVTVYEGQKGYDVSSKALTDVKILYTVVTRLEITKLKNEILSVDPEAFIVMTSVKDLKGGMIKKRGFQH
ncbi:hypothetical protein DNU06_14885 [Putridiphycobacter roseus]|uniref:DUF2179 domain-containing protein n=1 Tax=Putridiphycobacter roseus TaxID=2219161 RepID=A0A2W1MY15_9FLAO|nr:YitT family protein [Putridiphycobacter roseus]PZE16080.1 hypothetical protein DNU06_14885 [Putridiphycobacter roseus]